MKRRPSRPSPRSRPTAAPRKPSPARAGRTAPAPPVPTASASQSGPIQYASHVAPVGVLAESTLSIVLEVERSVLEDGRRADRSLAFALRRRRDLAAPDHRFISEAAFALFRWRGWIDPLNLRTPEARLLIATLLDARAVHPVCRAWARAIGKDPDSLIALGDAPTWPAKAEGLRRLLDGQPVTADPWRLFPDWFREHLPMPPGEGPTKTRFVEFLKAMQDRPSLWVRAQGPDASATWDELNGLGVKPWVHRRIDRAARLDPDVDIYHLPPFERGALEIQDLASQAVGIACDPDPGERWWDVCTGAGGKGLHLATLMQGKGLVVATDVDARKLKEAVRRARRSPWRNLTTKTWDGRHVAGKAGSFDGVLVDAPCSAIGTWRRNPDARWTIDRRAIPRLAALQGEILHAAAPGVRSGGTLIYSVCTLTMAETTGVVDAFLAAHSEFRLDPFPNPLTCAPTPGTLAIWPQDSGSDGMFLARFIRVATSKGVEGTQTPGDSTDS